MAGCVDGFQLELSSFAHQTVTFARQHGQYALLWRVMNTILSEWQLPLAPNLAAPFILAMNDLFCNHRRFREQMLHHMAKNVRTALPLIPSCCSFCTLERLAHMFSTCISFVKSKYCFVCYIDDLDDVAADDHCILCDCRDVLRVQMHGRQR